jgi:hypothetical protein
MVVNENAKLRFCADPKNILLWIIIGIPVIVVRILEVLNRQWYNLYRIIVSKNNDLIEKVGKTTIGNIILMCLIPVAALTKLLFLTMIVMYIMIASINAGLSEFNFQIIYLVDKTSSATIVKAKLEGLKKSPSWKEFN